MTRRQQYLELALWAESAEGPDRERDAEFWLMVKPGVTRKQWSYIHTASGKECHVDETRDETGRLITVPAYTSCLTTLTAVIVEVLPSWRVDNLCEWDDEKLRERGPWMCDLQIRGKPLLDHFPAKCPHARTPSLALFAALCRALAEGCGDA